MKNKKTIVFTSLAENQTRYFIKLAQYFKEKENDVCIICFHDSSVQLVDAAGIEVYSVYSVIDLLNGDLKNPCIDEWNLFTSHERLVFQNYNSDKLDLKMKKYFSAILFILSKLNEKNANKVVLIQEFGGFISLVSSYYAAKHLDIDNIFIEPSFFTGRFFLSRNTFTSPKISNTYVKHNDLLNEYLKHAQEKRVVVIPEKDKLHYRTPLSKLYDQKNIKRVFTKLLDKFYYKREEEFNHIAVHITLHVKMLITKLRLKKYYSNINTSKKIIYFPLHVPNDASLTIRSPEYHDQYAILDYLCRILPKGYTLCFKEHPALIGSIDYYRIKKILTTYDNIILLSPDISNYRVIESSEMVITINSKTGAEALLMSKNTVVLGDAFYKNCPWVKSIKTLDGIREIMKNINSHFVNPSDDDINYFYGNVWDSSYPGELYSEDLTKINDSCVSIEQYIDIE